MIESNRHRTEKAVEIDQSMPSRGVDKIRAAAFFEIDNDLEAVEQNVLLQHVKNAGSVDIFSGFAFTQTRPRGAGRLGEQGRRTHPLIVICARNPVNLSDEGLLRRTVQCLFFGGRFCQGYLVLRELRIVSDVAFHIAVKKIPLFQTQRLAPGIQSLEFTSICVAAFFGASAVTWIALHNGRPEPLLLLPI